MIQQVTIVGQKEVGNAETRVIYLEVQNGQSLRIHSCKRLTARPNTPAGVLCDAFLPCFPSPLKMMLARIQLLFQPDIMRLG